MDRQATIFCLNCEQPIRDQEERRTMQNPEDHYETGALCETCNRELKEASKDPEQRYSNKWVVAWIDTMEEQC